jgi:hypothetical protein
MLATTSYPKKTKAGVFLAKRVLVEDVCDE